ncbi:FUSC family protein [Mycetocola sp.]|uniref:FUSC family protein n=1 Tax=Mycetocola sp. TaxID=1871042 RepID=UPI003989124A
MTEPKPGRAPSSILFDPRELLQWGPHLGAHRVTIRVFFSVLIPLLVLFATDRLDLSAYALLAALASVYGRNSATRDRLIVQAGFGVVQVVLIIAGAAMAASDAPGWLFVAITAVIAGLGTVLADARGWRPAGSVFFVFGFGVSASLPAIGAGVGLAALLAVSSLIFTLLVTLTSGMIKNAQRRAGKDVAEYPPRTIPQRNWKIIGTHAAMCLLGAGIAGGIPLSFGWPHPYWAMVSAVVPVVGATTAGQLVRASHRVSGTLLGLVVALLLFGYAPQGLLLVILLVVLQAGTELVVARNYSAALLFLTPLTIGMGLLNGPVPVLPLVLDRGLETVVGVAVAVVLILATHGVRHPRVR